MCVVGGGACSGVVCISECERWFVVSTLRSRVSSLRSRVPCMAGRCRVLQAQQSDALRRMNAADAALQAAEQGVAEPAALAPSPSVTDDVGDGTEDGDADAKEMAALRIQSQARRRAATKRVKELQVRTQRGGGVTGL